MTHPSLTSLLAEIKKRAEFRKYECCDRDETLLMIGEQDENIRLQPIIQAQSDLIGRMATQLHYECCCTGEMDYDGSKVICDACEMVKFAHETLSRLVKA